MSVDGLLRRITSTVESCGIDYAVVGGLAVSARAEPRLTRDADLAVAVSDDNEAEDLIRRLRDHGYQLSTLIEHEHTGRLSTARLFHRDDGGLVADLLFASSGIEPEIISEAEHLDLVPGLTLPVATAGHLIVTKLLARDDRSRPMDADDLRSLSAVATDRDWQLAIEGVELVHKREFNRNRDLRAALRLLMP